MPASKHGEVQTNKSDGRKFTTMKVGSNGEVLYQRIYLRTKDAKVARKRAMVLDGVTDPEEARRLIQYLDSSRTPEQEQQRIAELTKNTPLIPFMTQERARRELEGIVCEHGDYAPGEIDEDVVDAWRKAASASEWRAILLSLGVPDDYLDENPEVFVGIESRGRTVNVDYKPRHEAFAALFGLSADALTPDRQTRGLRLSACVPEFRKDQEQRNNTGKHIAACIHKFEAFVQFLKDKHIRALTKADFVRFSDHVVQSTGGLSNKTIRDRLKAVEVVLDTARARMDDDAFPEGLDNWLGVLKRDRRKRPYKSPRQNREPMPAGLLQGLLAKADEWARIDWRAYADSLPLPDGADKRKRTLQLANNITHARNLKRTGLMAHSMLCLAANVGAMPIDFARLEWSELMLDGDLPLYREDRAKPVHLLGSEVPRCCPLLPETLESLRRWQQHRQVEIAGGGAAAEQYARFVFTNNELTPFDQKDSSGVSKLLRQVRDAVDSGHWQFRHLRNIGSTLCRDHRLPEAMADAWLGQSARQTNKFYTGEAKDDYLLPLVKIIGETYFKVSASQSSDQPVSTDL